MATFLTTPKMSPALAARIEASVRGRTTAQASGRPPTLVAVARLVAVTVMVVIVGVVGTSWQRRQTAEEVARVELLSAVERERDSLDARHHQLVSRTESLLVEAKDASHDVVAAELREPEELKKLLAREFIYVRGESAAFEDEPRMREAVGDSVKDAFVLCLFDPPAARTEKALLAQVHVAYAGGLEKRTSNVHRLQSAAVILPLLTRDWMKRVEEAPSLIALGKLRTTFDRAPFERGKAAARADLLLYVFDDAPEAGATIELDGASRHDVRVGIVDIASGKPLLRMSAKVDPAWISEDNRAQLGRGLDGCRLALDVRAHLTPE